MIAVAIAAGVALGVVGLGVVAALWDGVRRALAAQVRGAELRVEAIRAHDVDGLAEALKETRALLEETRRELDSLSTGLAMGRRR